MARKDSTEAGGSRGSRPHRSGCLQHHYVWFDGEPIVKVGCAHCSVITKEIDMRATTSREEVDRLIASSRSGHARLCDRGVRPPTKRRWTK